MTLEEFATYIAATREPNVYVGETAGHIAGFKTACLALGLEIRREDDRQTGFYRDGRLIGELRGMVSDLTTDAAVALCQDKTRTLDLLRAAGVPTPDSRYFLSDTGQEAAFRHWQRGDGTQIVVKPCDGRGGKGITVGIPDTEAFHQAWAEARENLVAPAGSIILEERVDGLDVRAIVVDGRFVCAATRVQAHIIGDGQSTVAELVAQKNALRQTNPAHRNYPLRVQEQGDAIPAAGQVWFLTDRANIHQGGQAVDVTETLPASLQRLAERAALAIPGLGVAGVDLIANVETGTAMVIELNTSCNFDMHYFPVYGTPRNPARAVLDHMVERADRGIIYRSARRKRLLARIRNRLHRLVRQ